MSIVGKDVDRLNKATSEEWDKANKVTASIREPVYNDDRTTLGIPLYPPSSASPFDTQVGGDHYKQSKHQPLEVCYDRHGFEAFRGACLTKIDKYLMRDKTGQERVLEYEKAKHVLDMLIEKARAE